MKVTLTAALLFAALLAPPTVNAEPRPSRPVRDSIRVDTRIRHYQLHVPRAYSEGTLAPLLFVFHGGSQSAKDMQMISRFDALSAENGFIAVYPEALDERWNDGADVANQRLHPPDDATFIARLVAKLSALYSIDQRKIYAAGYSDGGTMVFKLACSLPGLFAGISTVAASFPRELASSCEPPEALSVLMINGTHDGMVPWLGTDPRIRTPESALFIPVEDTAKFWAHLAGCKEPPAKRRVPDLDVKNIAYTDEYRFESCRPGIDVVLYALVGGGHSWPVPNLDPLAAIVVGRLAKTKLNDLDASKLIWRFLSRQKRPEKKQ